MNRSTKQSSRPSAKTIVIALLVGLAVLVLVFAWGGGIETQPPTCFGMFGWYTVPCEGWLAPTEAAVAAVAVGLALWLRDRRGR